MRVAGIFSVLVVSASAAGANPLGQVFGLIENLKGQITREGEVEAKAYKKFTAWCDHASQSSGFEIKTAKSKKAHLEANIEVAESDVEVGTAKIGELSGAISSAEAELKDAAAIRKQEAVDFAASEKELISTVGTLERAISILEKEMAKSGSAALAQIDSRNLQSVVQTLGAVVDAAGFSSDDHQRLLALVQGQQQEENEEDDFLSSHAAANYASKSGSVVDLLEDLKEKAEGELADARKAEKESKHNFAMLKQSLTDKTGADNKDMGEQKSGVAEAKEEGSVAAGDLDVTKDALNADSKTLAMIKKDCMRTASDHEATVAARAEELKTLDEVVKILKEATAGAAAASFLQVRASSKLSAGSRSRMEAADSEVVAIVKKLATAHHSTALSQLASRITAVLRYGNSAGDPYAKVKGMLNDMLSKLQKEAEQEAGEKAYCDEQLSKTKAKLDQLDDDAAALTSQIDKAAARAASLKEEVAGLQSALAATTKSQAEIEEVRRNSHADYVVAKKELTEGLTGIRKGLGVLRDYYGGDSAAAAAMIQEGVQDQSEQPKPPEKHQKNSGAGGGIIDILEVCESNFATNLAKEETEEADEVASYEELTQENKLTSTSKTQDVKFKTQEAAGLDKTIADVTNDKESVNTELSAVMEYYAKIQKRCIAQPESYEARKKAREEEIAGLKEGMSVLEDAAAFLQKKHRIRRHRSHFLESTQ